jgi:hypothetical protein
MHGMISNRENINAITKNSTFIDGGIYADNNFIFNSKLLGTSTQECDKLLIIYNSTLSGQAHITGKAYMIDNRYTTFSKYLPLTGETLIMGFGVHADKDSFVYIASKHNDPASLSLFGGHITLEGHIIVNLDMSCTLEQYRIPKDKNIYLFSSLHLKNIHITGGEWKDIEIHEGQWENVKIEPTVLVDNVIIKNVQAYNLEFPKGPPWKKGPYWKGEGTFIFEVTPSLNPLQRETPHVPTPEELGLVWWPAVEPGYHP